MKKLEDNSMGKAEGNSMEKLEDDALDQVSGGILTVESHPNGDIKIANYYCDKCGALVSVQKDGKFETKMEHSMSIKNGERIILCAKCKAR